MRHKFFVLLLGIFLFNAFAVKAQSPDAEIIIHERVLNRLLQKIGSIKGESDYKVLFVSGRYKWTMEKSMIHLLRDSAYFEADLSIETGFNTYTNKVIGRLLILYHEKTNKISIKIIDAPFPIILKVFGKEITVARIQLADYFPEEFLFDGPGTIHSDFEMIMPDHSKRRFRGYSKKHQLSVNREIIRLVAEIDFAELGGN